MACVYVDKHGDVQISVFAKEPRLARYKRPRCGARTRKGAPCRAPAVWDRDRDRPRNGRCKLHGGLSTGANTDEGRARLSQNMAERMRRYWAARAEAKAVNSADKWTHIVLSPIPAGPDRVYQVGERVNAAEWRNREALERQRFIERC